jgi:hypothetical protein
VTAHSWTELADIIKSTRSGGSATVTLALGFACDYNTEIAIPAGANCTIHGNGAELDAAQKGRFFYVTEGAALALDHLVLRNGHSLQNGGVSGLHHSRVQCSNFQPFGVPQF